MPQTRTSPIPPPTQTLKTFSAKVTCNFYLIYLDPLSWSPMTLWSMDSITDSQVTVKEVNSTRVKFPCTTKQGHNRSAPDAQRLVIAGTSLSYFPGAAHFTVT